MTASIVELLIRSFCGGGTSGPSAQFLHPSLLQPHPCSIEGERGAEASEAASRMMQSMAKVFASERAAARLAVGFGFLPSFCNGDGVGWGVFSAERLILNTRILVEMTVVVSWYAKAPTPSPCCVWKAVKCCCENMKACHSLMLLCHDCGGSACVTLHLCGLGAKN